MNLQSGINIGSWRLRDNSTWSYNSGSSNSSDSNKWQHINTSAERDIIPLRSRLTVGDSYTDGDIFDSVNFRGLKINSTEAMLPDSQHGFAPVIHGIARGTAQVSVKQNGYDVYQTTVPPGPFTIDDINSATNGGDLQVTIKEADGSIQTLYVPYSSVPVLQRAGYTRYALAMGEYRSGNNLQSSPKFIQGSLMHGLEGNWTPYGGMQIAEDYQAFNLGIGKDLGLFGAFSFDITQANTTLADGTRHSGQSVKSVYSKSFYQTGTNIQVAGYRYSTQGFYNLSDSAYSRMSGYTVKPPTGDTNEQTQFIDYFNLFYSKRGQEQISISQQLGNKEANVNLGDLYTRNLQQPGSASGWHNITLSLTDCPVETSAVTAIVTGSTDNTGYYKNEGTAENIQIELRDDQDAALKNGDSKTVIVDEITRNAQFPLKARAITVNGNASQGTIEALINVIYTWQ
ncbi:fimbria/pilus outer membrane usher protein [Escherichia coli]